MATYYADISNAYNDLLGNRAGTIADPFRAANVRAFLQNGIPWAGWGGANLANGDVFQTRGLRSPPGTGMWDNMDQASTIFEPWDVNEPPAHTIPGGGAAEAVSFTLFPPPPVYEIQITSFFFFYCYIQSISGIHTFRNCKFADDTTFQCNDDDVTAAFYGCSFGDAVFYFTPGGVEAGQVVTFEYCYFDTYVFNSNADWANGTGRIICRNCLFTESQAAVTAALTADSRVTFENCVFGVSPARPLPAFEDESASSLEYYSYGLPLILGTPASWTDNDYELGLYGSVRSGYGAFNFDPEFAITASSTSGPAPLEVEFSPNIVNEDLTYSWNFGDQTSSTETSPIHVFLMPGEYTVTMTVTDGAGNTYTATITIYVYENDYSAGGRNVTKTNKCFRFGIPQEEVSQGIGWSEYNGEFWPLPVGLIGCNLILDENDEEVQLCVDGNTFYTYQLGREDHWTDAGNAEYLGADYEAEILFREHMNPVGATSRQKHSQSRLDFKPWWKDRRSTGTYNPLGFREAFNADLFVRRDSEPYDAGVTERIPYRGQLVFDRNFDSDFLQMGTRVRGAPWRLTYAEQWYFSRDTGGTPTQKYMTEMQWSQQLSEPLIWIARDSELQTSLALPFNAAIGERVTGSYTGLMTGPDGYAQSAFVLGTTGSFVTSVAADAEEFSLVMWLRSPQARLVLWEATEGGLVVALVHNPDGSIKIEWIDDNEHFNIPVSVATADWFMLTLVRRGENLVAYENDSLINTYGLTAEPTNVGGDMTMCQGACGLWGARMVPRVINADCISYLYNDVRDNQANATENIF